MKTQSSLEVPKQVRSASFDEIQLEAKRHQNLVLQQGGDGSGGPSGTSSLLKVPQYINQRSKSVDSGGSDESSTYLEVPRRFQRRRSSGSKTPICVHCVCLEEYLKQKSSDVGSFEHQSSDPRSFSLTDDDSDNTSSDDEDDSPATIGSPEPIPIPPHPCSITVTLSPTIEPPLESPPPAVVTHQMLPLAIEHLPGDEVEVPTTPTRRRSIQRQEAFFAEPTGNSLENMSDAASDVPSEYTSEASAYSEGDTTNVTLPQGLIVRDIYLAVPDLKRDRAASVDSCFSKVSQGKTEELQHSGVSLEVPVSPNVALRSRSVDIVLPTDEQARYKALAMTNVTTTAASTSTTTNQTVTTSLARGYVNFQI